LPIVGQGIHFLQEDSSDAIGEAIADWYRRMIRHEATR
jgi:hypothetical protein